MRPRALLIFILLNVLVTTGVAFAIISLFGGRESASQVVQFATVEVIITATRDPNVTPERIIITATPRPGEVSQIPTGVLDATAAGNTGGNPGDTTPGGDGDSAATSGTPITGSTIDPALLESDPGLASTAAALPANCILHTLVEGEFPSLLAEQYGTDVNSILFVNGLNEEDAAFLQIGQVLIIPLADCPLDAIPTPDTADTTGDEADTGTEEVTGTDEAGVSESLTPAVTPSPTVTATITLPPTAADAQLEIVEVKAPGDVTAEAVVIRNNGRNVTLTGWTLSDLEGNVYTFPERNLFSNGEITLFTGVGQNTAVVMYQGADRAIFGEPGDVVTLRDANGVVQAVYRITGPVILP